MPRLFRPALPLFALTLSAALGAGIAHAEQVPIAGGDSIEISPPNGYCALDESRAAEASFIKTIRGTVGSSMRLALAFGDCAELVELRDGKRSVLDNFGQMLLLATADGAVRQVEETQADFLASIAKSFPAGSVADIAANGAAQFEAKAGEAPQPLFLVVGRDARALYVATTKVQGGGQQRSVVAGLAAITLVRHASVTINLFSAYDGSKDKGEVVLAGLTEQLKVGVEEIQFLNEDVPATPAPLPVPSRSEWKAMASTALIGAAIGGTLGGLGALIVYWLRRRRRSGLAAALPGGESATAE